MSLSQARTGLRVGVGSLMGQSNEGRGLRKMFLLSFAYLAEQLRTNALSTSSLKLRFRKVKSWTAAQILVTDVRIIRITGLASKTCHRTMLIRSDKGIDGLNWPEAG
jgi:hypothetical protein